MFLFLFLFFFVRFTFTHRMDEAYDLSIHRHRRHRNTYSLYFSFACNYKFHEWCFYFIFRLNRHDTLNGSELTKMEYRIFQWHNVRRTPYTADTIVFGLCLSICLMKYHSIWDTWDGWDDSRMANTNCAHTHTHTTLTPSIGIVKTETKCCIWKCNKLHWSD